jgi:tetratricopeptide (TPR) repeat protein
MRLKFPPILTKLSIFLTFSGIILLVNSGKQTTESLVLAAVPDANPLTTTPSDPLLPEISVKRPLTSLERKRIETEIAKLDRQAQNQLESGNEREAFSLWYRELRLQRAMGRLAEIDALGRVGEIAWSNNLAQDLRNISERLVNIEQEVINSEEINLKLLKSLGKAYQQVRELDRAIVIYQQLLTESQNDLINQQNILEALGKLYLAKFDYQQAADIYERLLTLLASNNNNIVKSQAVTKAKKQIYLEELARIYNFSSQPSQAITIKEQLAQQYLDHHLFEQLTRLKVSLAQDYQNLNKLALASQNYQEAVSLALSLQQFSLASEALQKLGQLYYSTNQLEQALATYQQLIQVEQQSYNFYGLMNTYDRIGNIYYQTNNYSKALAAFQQGLKLANSLNYRVDYFTNQIQKVEHNISK